MPDSDPEPRRRNRHRRQDTPPWLRALYATLLALVIIVLIATLTTHPC